jgi:5-amino-6-(5-phosphoribosylamino)uracil reductase
VVRVTCWDVDVITLWPVAGAPAALDDATLAAQYAYPDALAEPWVRVSFVTSADGAVAVEGRSAGLGSRADRKIFGLLRRLADVILVGAGTVRAEDYRGARGRDPAPIAVISGSANIDPGSRLFTDTAVAPIVLTLESAPPHRRERLAAAGADVSVLTSLAPRSVLAELARRGLHRVLCEGGPTVLGDLVADDAVDELCLTISPLLAGGSAGRIARSVVDAPGRPLELVSALHEDGVLLLRYTRRKGETMDVRTSV